VTGTALALWFLLAPASCAWITLTRRRWSMREQCEICALVGALIGISAAVAVNRLF
jgi:hypothetical protein